jgi:hypothetical protein
MGRRLRCSSDVSVQICSLLTPCRRPILIATKYLVFRGQDTRNPRSTKRLLCSGRRRAVYFRMQPGFVWSEDNSIKLLDLDERPSPIAVLDDFRVCGRPFGPHPHAGSSALTYVFEDSRRRKDDPPSYQTLVRNSAGRFVLFLSVRC